MLQINQNACEFGATKGEVYGYSKVFEVKGIAFLCWVVGATKRQESFTLSHSSGFAAFLKRAADDLAKTQPPL